MAQQGGDFNTVPTSVRIKSAKCFFVAFLKINKRQAAEGWGENVSDFRALAEEKRLGEPASLRQQTVSTE